METISKNLKNNINFIKDKTGNSPDIIIKELSLFNTKISVIFNETLSDKEFIDKIVLVYFNKELRNNIKKKINILNYIETTIPTHKTVKIKNYSELFYNLLCGFTIIIIEGEKEALSLETRAQLDSGILEAQNEQVIKGPKDAFTENYQTNIGLVRRRIKSEDLWLEEMVLGTKTKTKVGIFYIQNIANKKLVDNIIKKIEKIEIDSILDSNYIIETISENKRNFFSNYISSERPDVISMYLLEGRIAIVVENTQYVVVIPAFFIDFFHTTEDFYRKIYNVNFVRVVRIIAFFIAILIPALYIAIATFNIEAIPNQMLMSFATQRDGVPLPTVLETLMMITVFEILRETDARIPSAIGSSLSIVGAIVLGQAAVMANIVSPVTIIVVSLTSISGMISFNMDMVGGIRWWKIIFLLFAAVFGLFGIVIAGLIFIIYVTSIKSFGIPYLTPIAPFYIDEQRNSLFLTNKRKFKFRSFITAKKNKKRSGETK